MKPPTGTPVPTTLGLGRQRAENRRRFARRAGRSSLDGVLVDERRQLCVVHLYGRQRFLTATSAVAQPRWFTSSTAFHCRQCRPAPMEANRRQELTMTKPCVAWRLVWFVGCAF